MWVTAHSEEGGVRIIRSGCAAIAEHGAVFEGQLLGSKETLHFLQTTG